MKKRFFASIMIFAFLFAVSCQSQGKIDAQHIVKIGDVAPDFTLEFVDGKKVKLSDLKGVVVMLQFTASWCSVCNKEMPFIESEIHQKYKDNPKFAVFGVDLKESSETIRKFKEKTKVTYPILLDEDGSIFELYAEKDAGVTRNVIIDKNGRIQYLTRLFNREEFDAMKLKIAELLSE